MKLFKPFEVILQNLDAGETVSVYIQMLWLFLRYLDENPAEQTRTLEIELKRDVANIRKVG